VLATTTVGADGAFTLTGSTTTPYITLIVSTSGTTPLAGTTFDAMYDSTGVKLDVFAGSPSETFITLSSSGDADIGLQVGYEQGLSGAGTGQKTVGQYPVTSSGSLSWSQTSTGSSETAKISNFVWPGYYKVVGVFAQKACGGYLKPSATGSEINCDGNCETGEGYCYSSADGMYCEQCNLHSTPPGGKLCTDYGTPQSVTQLPNGDGWTDTCQAKWEAEGGPAKYDMPCSGRAMESSPVVRVFAKGKLVRTVSMVGATLQENAGGSRAFLFMCMKMDTPSDDSPSTVIDSVIPIDPSILMTTAGLTEAKYASFSAGALKCTDEEIPVTTNACSSFVCPI